MVRWISTRPAELAGLESSKGRISPGYDADFAIFDPEASFTVRPEDLHFRHLVSPYIGECLKGRVEMTFVRGQCVFERGQFAAHSAGRECRVSKWSTAS
jgi:allantoinase